MKANLARHSVRTRTSCRKLRPRTMGTNLRRLDKRAWKDGLVWWPAIFSLMDKAVGSADMIKGGGFILKLVGVWRWKIRLG